MRSISQMCVCPCVTLLINLALEFPLVGTFQTINASNELVYLLQMCFSPGLFLSV